MNNEVIMDGLSKLYNKMHLWIESSIKMLPNLLIAIVIFFIFLKLSSLIYNAVSRSLKSTHFNESLNHLLANVSRILVICIGIVFALGVLQLQKTVFSLLAGVGVIGLALGFAFQDLAANFISGIMLAVRSPMKIGDVIKINEVQGSVEEINLRDTLIRNFDGQDVIIPNKEFTANKLTNYSSFGRRKIKIEVGIGYEDDPAKAIDVMTKALSGVEGVLSDPSPEVYVETLGGSSVNLFGNIWFTYPGGSFLGIRSAAIQSVKRELEKEGFNIPFPIRTLDIPKDTLKSLSGRYSEGSTKEQTSLSQ